MIDLSAYILRGRSLPEFGAVHLRTGQDMQRWVVAILITVCNTPLSYPPILSSSSHQVCTHNASFSQVAMKRGYLKGDPIMKSLKSHAWATFKRPFVSDFEVSFRRFPFRGSSSSRPVINICISHVCVYVYVCVYIYIYTLI